jgi:mannose-1-phosphate guanylyltransferase
MYRPEIAAQARAAVAAGREDGRRFHPDEAAFAAIKGESVDYAVMEHTAKAAMVPAAMGWSDIGNWGALHDARTHDAAGNTVRGTAELVDCRNVLVESDGPRVSAIGLDDVVIVVDGDEVLVTTRAGAQLVGKLGGASNQ